MGWSRAWFVVAVFAMLIAPAVVQALNLDPFRPVAENRLPAPPPAMPRRWDEAMRTTAALDAYIRDRFGLRQPMVRANNWLRWTLFHEVTSPDLLVGKHGRVFLGAHSGGVPNSMIALPCGAGVTDQSI